MMPGPLFESTESVIEILWDVALAVFVIRIAFFYVSLAAAATALFAWSAPKVLPAACLPSPSSPPLEASPGGCSVTTAALTLGIFSVLIAALCARVTSFYFALPRVATYRLAIGAMSLVYIVLGSLAVAFVVPPREWPIGHVALSAVFTGAIALMPWLSMWLLERPAKPMMLDSRQQLPVSDQKRQPDIVVRG